MAWGQAHEWSAYPDTPSAPPEARQKPKVAAYTSAKLDKILQLRPDLVLAFLDLQADLVRDLVKLGLTVLITNQRSLSQTWDAIRLIGRALGCAGEAERLAADLEDEVQRVHRESRRLSYRPRV